MNALRPLRKVHIANRGEIAIRVARTARRMGLKTVALFAEQDRESQHLDFCDEAHSLGVGPISDTYLSIERVLGIARQSGADCIHPGYGFLSERATFAKACADAGVKFVGPQPQSMDEMGDKIRSKQFMKALGVPLVPGSDGAVSDKSEARQIADRVGYPVLLKASAGGGGKGMRIVHSASELEAALEGAAREAKAYFGDGTVFIEKYLTSPHHVEVQVVGDGEGGGGHVFDRECSIQRRHQKLLEESPAPLLGRHPASKKKLLDLSQNVVARMKYESAGTLEYVADDDGNVYFLEMNTRLQVEHPVTEWVTGIDLVERQFRVAMGERLKAEPLASAQRGHAIEVRIYSETPFDHLPTGGRVVDVLFPQGPFVRVDSAIYPGYDVPTEYDPTLLKLSVWGEDRSQAIDRLASALEELRILGVQSNQALFRAICSEPDFRKGMYGTPYLDLHRAALQAGSETAFADLVKRVGPALLNQSVGGSAIVGTGVESLWAWNARRSGQESGL